MNPENASMDPVAKLEEHLKGQASRANFDMYDEEEFPFLKPFRELHEAAKWLGKELVPKWAAADAYAIKHQVTHQILANTAIGTGAGAIILAVLQLALNQSWPSMTAVAAWMEGTTVLAALISVIVGHKARSDQKWLSCRHRAERLRMLKFTTLAYPELWSGHLDEWKNQVRKEMEDIPDPPTLEEIEAWSQRDACEAPGIVQQGMPAPMESRRALAVYYRYKRLANQGDYFKRKGAEAENAWTVKMRRHRLRLFALTIICVLFHFAADFLAGDAETRVSAHFWELASVWAIVLAAVLPVLGLAFRAWSAAFELARKARSFAAKHRAMDAASAVLGDGKEDLAVIQFHLRHDELFLEQEHREWLRLLLDAEWFL